jgi:transcriptional regulator
MDHSKSDVLQGTLDLMILKTLDTLGEMHGWGIAQRIKQVSQDLLQLNQSTLYPALLRVEQKGWIRSEWKITENNRCAKYYSLTRDGKKARRGDRRVGALRRLHDSPPGRNGIREAC